METPDAGGSWKDDLANLGSKGARHKNGWFRLGSLLASGLNGSTNQNTADVHQIRGICCVRDSNNCSTPALHSSRVPRGRLSQSVARRYPMCQQISLHVRGVNMARAYRFPTRPGVPRSRTNCSRVCFEVQRRSRPQDRHFKSKTLPGPREGRF